MSGALAAVLLSVAPGLIGVASAQQYYGGGPYGGMMGPGMMGGWMGPGMMYGYGPGGMMGGWMGPGMMYGYGYGPPRSYGYPPAANLNLSVADVEGYLQRWLALMDNPHLKLGPVVAKNSDTIIADIVTTDRDGLVERFSIDRKTGRYVPIQ